MWNSRLKQDGMGDLIPGLPDDIVFSCILPRLSWRSFPSLLGVNKSWKAAISSRRIANIRRVSPAFQENLLAVIHKSGSAPCDEILTEICRCSWIMDMDIHLAVSIYDPVLCAWEELPPIPDTTHGAPMFARCESVDGKLFLVGGCNPENWEPVQEMYKMDLAAGLRKWEKCSSMKTARANFASTSYDGKIFVAGGHGRESLVLGTAELYDVQKDEWFPLPDLKIPRSECLGAVLNNQVYIIGGYTYSPDDLPPHLGPLPDLLATQCISSMEVLDKHHTQWTFASCGGIPLQSFSVASGQLCPLTDRALVTFCSDSAAGKKAMNGMLLSHFENDEDETGTYLAVAAIFVNQDMYAITRDSRLCHGSEFSFCKGKLNKAFGQGAGTGVTWQTVECPFEIIELAPSCCSFAL